MKEKTAKIQRRTQSSSSHEDDTSQSEHIPLDLTIEILSRLPAKSVGRFRSVSKLWSAITTSQDVIDSFSTRSLSLRPSILLTARKGNMLFVYSCSLLKNSPFSCLGSYELTDLHDGYRYRYVRGLIFDEGSKQLVIWNPTMKRSVTLPIPKSTKRKCCGILGYDSIEGKYIVLRIRALGEYSEILIFTFGAQGQVLRKIIKDGVPWHQPTEHCGEYINGVMYYEAVVCFGVNNFEHRIMSFDIRSEKVNLIKFPETHDFVCDHMVLYEGRFAIIKTWNLPSIDIWILKDGDRHEWTHKGFVLPLAADMDPIRRHELRFCGVSDAGELVFAPWRLYESFYILYFDPRINSIREVLCEGTLGKEFRSGNGVGLDKECRYNMMNIYLNHIESLMSL